MDRYYDMDLRTYLNGYESGLKIPDFKTVLDSGREGLGHMHSHPTGRTYIHLDLKPENFMVQVELMDGLKRLAHVAITDFGHTRLYEPDDERLVIKPGYTKIGSSPYNSAPDQRYSHKVDMWAFGIILLEVATGEKPEGRDINDWYKEKKASLPELTGGMQICHAAIQGCLEWDADSKRFDCDALDGF